MKKEPSHRQARAGNACSLQAKSSKQLGYGSSGCAARVTGQIAHVAHIFRMLRNAHRVSLSCLQRVPFPAQLTRSLAGLTTQDMRFCSMRINQNQNRHTYARLRAA